MNVLFVLPTGINIKKHSISADIMHEFRAAGHEVYAACALDKKRDTYLQEEDGYHILHVTTGNNKKANIIEKGITTITMPRAYIKAIKKYFSDVTFDMILYPTPPVTHVKTIEYIKKRDGATSYLMLKDIFPQNAVDIGMMSKSGVKGILYKKFRRDEKKLYAVSDRIGCMSQANIDYVLAHNPEVDPAKLELCPNSIELIDMRISDADKKAIREKYELPLDKKIFVYGGNLGKPQGIPFLIKCLKGQKDNAGAYFLIVGDGTEYGKLERFITEEQPANVRLMKRIPKEDYDKLVAGCDVGMIFLDHRFTIPNFPSRLLGYLQAGLPVLAATDPNTDIGKVITEGGFGWWCESNSTLDFGKTIEAAISSDLVQLGEAGYTYLADNYQAKDTYKKIIRRN